MKELIDGIHFFIVRKYKSLDDFLWALKPKNWKFWIVKPKTLNVQYNTASDLYLHTSMQILCNFYYGILESGNTCWLYTEETLKVWKEIRAIVVWWEDVYPTYDLMWHEDVSTFNEEQFSDWCRDKAYQEELNEKTEQQMVERLSKIYKYLWD